MSGLNTLLERKYGSGDSESTVGSEGVSNTKKVVIPVGALNSIPSGKVSLKTMKGILGALTFQGDIWPYN